VSYPDYDPLGRLSHDGVVRVSCAVSVQPDHQVEVALVRIGFALLAHVVGRCFAEVQPTNRHLGQLLRVQVHPGTHTGPLLFHPTRFNLRFGQNTDKEQRKNVDFQDWVQNDQRDFSFLG